MELYTDAELLELMVNDNNKAFTVIYDRYFHVSTQAFLFLGLPGNDEEWAAKRIWRGQDIVADHFHYPTT